MHATYVGREIARATRNSLLAHGIVLASLVWLALAQRAWVADTIRGPADVEPSLVATADGLDHLAYRRVRLALDTLLPVGQRVSRDERSGTERVEARYALAPVEGRALLVTLAPEADFAGGRRAGVLTPLAGDVRQSLLQADVPADRLLPLQLDAGDGVWDDRAQLLVLVVLAGWSLWRVKVALDRRADPRRHPAAHRLAGYGGADALARQLDRALAGSRGGTRLLGATLAPGFLVRSTLFDTVVLPAEGVVWLYKKVTKRSVNFIPAGKAYAAVVHGAHGETVELAGSEAAVDAAARQLMQMAPWAIAGYDAGLAAAMRKHDGRAEVASAVAARRAAISRVEAQSA